MRYASVTLRVLHCVALRVLCCVACVVFVALRLRFVEVAFRCASGRCASSQAVLFRFGWLFPAAPGLSLLVPCSAEHKIGIFVRFFGFGTPIFRPFEHKIGVFVSEWAIFQRFLVFLTQKWGFCAREA